MTSLTTIQAELQDITQRLDEAADNINAGVTLDLSDLAPRTTILCENILQLPPEQALAMLTELNKAAVKLDGLFHQMKS